VNGRRPGRGMWQQPRPPQERWRPDPLRVGHGRDDMVDRGLSFRALEVRLVAGPDTRTFGGCGACLCVGWGVPLHLEPIVSTRSGVSLFQRVRGMRHGWWWVGRGGCVVVWLLDVWLCGCGGWPEEGVGGFWGLVEKFKFTSESKAEAQIVHESRLGADNRTDTQRDNIYTPWPSYTSTPPLRPARSEGQSEPRGVVLRGSAKVCTYANAPEHPKGPREQVQNLDGICHGAWDWKQIDSMGKQLT
jgi:hypothetical protein